MKFRRLIASVALLTIVFGLFGLGAIGQANAQTTDTQAPGFVSGVTATPGDASVTVKWNAATDNVGVTGYVVYHGTTSVAQAYRDRNEVIAYDAFSEIGNVLTTTISGLTNNTQYYFVVTAMDAAGNESANYSAEVSATPIKAAVTDDGTPPRVVGAVADGCNRVRVSFSEAIQLPTNGAAPFRIENLDSLQFLTVTSVALDESDSKVAVLSTADMEANAQYLLTVGSQIQDLSGKPVVSGTSDTGVFAGVACTETPVDEEPVDEEPIGGTDAEPPLLLTVTVVTPTELTLEFNENVIFATPTPDTTTPDAEPRNPALDHFFIVNREGITLEVTAVDYLEVEDPTAPGTTSFNTKVLVLTTLEHASQGNYTLTVQGLKDEAGNATDGDFIRVMEYTAPAFTVPDTIAPEDVTGFLSNLMDMAVALNWESSLNSAGDLVDHYLYVSQDGGQTYEKKETLGRDASSYTFEGGVEGKTYLFKVTTVDEHGNESEGVVTTVTLPMTGVGLGLLGGASLLGGRWAARRRRGVAAPEVK